MIKLARVLAIGCLLLSFSCQKKEEKVVSNSETPQTTHPVVQDDVAKTKVEFNKIIHNFGEIEQGEVVNTTFMIKNIGDNDLYILDAHGSCGCTVPEVTKDAIKPGESSPIKVTFDSNGKKGDLTKTVNIRCNTENAIEQVKIKVSIKTNK